MKQHDVDTAAGRLQARRCRRRLNPCRRCRRRPTPEETKLPLPKPCAVLAQNSRRHGECGGSGAAAACRVKHHIHRHLPGRVVAPAAPRGAWQHCTAWRAAHRPAQPSQRCSGCSSAAGPAEAAAASAAAAAAAHPAAAPQAAGALTGFTGVAAAAAAAATGAQQDCLLAAADGWWQRTPPDLQ